MTVKNMINLRNSPFLWFAILLLVAYGLAGTMPVASPDWMVRVAFILALGAGSLGWIRYMPGQQIWSTIAISIMVLLAGFIRITSYQRLHFQENQIRNACQVTAKVQVSEVLKRKTFSTTLRCKVIHAWPRDSTDRRPFRDTYVLVSLRDPPEHPLFPGDQLSGPGWLSPVSPPMNPHAFDLRTHYRSLTIRYRLSMKGGEIHVSSAKRQSIRRLTAQWQYTLSGMVHAHTSPASGQLTNALVWGDRSDMEQDVIDAFADSGAMHVLSVSGMHVAIIYSMLFFLLGPPGHGTFLTRMGRLLLYVTAILLYMALTGSSAAVVRAGWMIILFVTGKAMGWNTQIWNLLGFAAFVMLWLQPLIWHNIGFQLSFLAMAGLLLFTRPISRMISFKSMIMQRLWEICAVSLAAQVFILPLLLKQFHQFPLTFIASSIVSMPAGYVIIFGAIINVVLSAIGFTGGWALQDICGTYFIRIMKWMAELNPVMHYDLPAPAAWSLMAVAVFFSFGVLYTWTWGKRLAYGAGIMTVLWLIQHRMTQWTHEDIVVYHNYKGILIDHIQNGHCFSIRDTTTDAAAIEFAAKGHRAFRDIISIQEMILDPTSENADSTAGLICLQVAGEKWMLYHDELDVKKMENPIDVVITQKAHSQKAFSAMLLKIKPALIVIPAHVPAKDRRMLIRNCIEKQIPYHDISISGCYHRRI